VTRSSSSRGGGGATPDEQAEIFRRQAAHFTLLGSPVYARLAGRLAEDPRPARAVLGDGASWDLGLRLFGAVHHHVLTGAAPRALSGEWGDFTSALDEHAGSLRRFVREQRVQTNETQRCVSLLPAFLTVARETGLPLDLIELGPSAGLNLVFDRYRYRYAEGAHGDPGARLAFDATERGRVPGGLLATRLEVVRRRGIDLSPLDATSEEDVVLLHSFLWPGLAERKARLDAAIATFREAPHRPELIRGDYVELLPGLLADRDPRVLTVVFQTASTGYLADDRYALLRGSLDRAGADGGPPLAWISSRRREERETADDHHYELELRIWPAPARLVAFADFHGNWIDWVDA
jgi:hypothetical protein